MQGGRYALAIFFVVHAAHTTRSTHPCTTRPCASQADPPPPRTRPKACMRRTYAVARPPLGAGRVASPPPSPIFGNHMGRSEPPRNCRGLKG